MTDGEGQNTTGDDKLNGGGTKSIGAKLRGATLANK